MATNNIEKLYELAKVKKKGYCDFACIGSDFCNNFCEDYEDIDLYYPPFTDTKQLNLIKYFSENIYCIELSHNGREFEFYSSGSRDRNKDFSQALASFIYYKWDDLTDEQKEEIKRILE